MAPLSDKASTMERVHLIFRCTDSIVCRWREAVRCDDVHASTRHPLGQVCKHDRAGRPQSWQSAAAAMGALLRGGAAVVVRSTSGTSGWQPRLRIMVSTGCSPRDAGRQAGIEVARWCVRPLRRCHGPSGRAPRARPGAAAARSTSRHVQSFVKGRQEGPWLRRPRRGARLCRRWALQWGADGQLLGQW
jgi:hypothetical protein